MNTKNIALTILSFAINTVVSFFLAPYVIQKLGIEAYGFVTLGTQFVNYIALVSIALNSMASRFISIEIHKDNWNNVNKYFSSIIYANLLLLALLFIPIFLIIFYLGDIISINQFILKDVQILFVFLFIHYFLTTIFNVLAISTFVNNKLYLKSLREIESKILYAILLVLLFSNFSSKVYYIGLATVVTSVYLFFFNWYYLKKFLPKIRMNLSYFSFDTIRDLIKSGIWNTIIHLGQILTQGLDLLLVNVFIGASFMGVLAVSKTIPVIFISLVGLIAATYSPIFTKHYASDDKVELLKTVKQSMKTLGVIVNVPIAVFAVVGNIFYKLWLPEQNATQLHLLSTLAMLTIVFSGPINSLYSIFTVTNNVKKNAIIVVISGILNILIVWLLFKYFNIEMETMIIVSLVLGVLRNIIFTAPYGAKCLGIEWDSFYSIIFKSVITFLVIYYLLKLINLFIDINDWLSLIMISIVFGVMGILINFYMIFNKIERNNLILKINSFFIKSKYDGTK